MTPRRLRLIATTLVLAFLFASLAPTAHAAVRGGSTNVGWARVARVVWRKIEPYVLPLADLVYDTLTGGSTPPPPPPQPIEPPPVPDPDYTP